MKDSHQQLVDLLSAVADSADHVFDLLYALALNSELQVNFLL